MWSTFCGCGLFGDRSMTLPATQGCIPFFSERVVQAWDNCLVGVVVVVGVAYLAVQVQNCFLRPCMYTGHKHIHTYTIIIIMQTYPIPLHVYVCLHAQTLFCSDKIPGMLSTFSSFACTPPTSFNDCIQLHATCCKCTCYLVPDVFVLFLVL